MLGHSQLALICFLCAQLFCTNMNLNKIYNFNCHHNSCENRTTVSLGINHLSQTIYISWRFFRPQTSLLNFYIYFTRRTSTLAIKIFPLTAQPSFYFSTTEFYKLKKMSNESSFSIHIIYVQCMTTTIMSTVRREYHHFIINSILYTYCTYSFSYTIHFYIERERTNKKQIVCHSFNVLDDNLYDL